MKVPLAGWRAAVTYFVTGEQITRRVYLTELRRPFGYYNGRLNPGAIELYFRSATDTGVNWYWNHYVRMYFDWQHSMYNRPVFISDTKSIRENNLFWFRTQVFF